MLATPFKNVGIRLFETLSILPNCISPISAVLILRMADFIFSWKAMLLWSVWAHHMTLITTWAILMTAKRWTSYRGCQSLLKASCVFKQCMRKYTGEQTWNVHQRILSFVFQVISFVQMVELFDEFVFYSLNPLNFGRKISCLIVGEAVFQWRIKFAHVYYQVHHGVLPIWHHLTPMVFKANSTSKQTRIVCQNSYTVCFTRLANCSLCRFFR